MTNLVRAMVVLAALAATGRADELPAAARHYVAGKELYDAHLYRRALAEFEAGYVASELPGFLLDMAQCHRQLGERDDALRDYRSYLARDATSATAHSLLAKKYRVQPCWRVVLVKAGSHWTAWESPTRAMVREPSAGVSRQRCVGGGAVAA